MNCVNKYVSIECLANDCDHNCNGMCVSENVEITNDKDNKAKCKTFSI